MTPKDNKDVVKYEEKSAALLDEVASAKNNKAMKYEEIWKECDAPKDDNR